MSREFCKRLNRPPEKPRLRAARAPILAFPHKGLTGIGLRHGNAG